MKFLDLAAFNHFVRLLNSPYTIAFGLSLLIPTHEMAATTGMSAGSSKPYSSKPTFQTPVKKEEPPQQQQYKPLVKTEMPPMAKPFGMPGVVGLQNEKWVGTDYLGYLSNQIGIFVEILKAEAVPSISDTALIERRVAAIFTKDDIVPVADVSEGPPLPFLHLLLVIYPIDKDRYSIMGSGRLFERIQVMRKDFVPAGYWQGITWENQDILVADHKQLDARVQEMADKLASDFVVRYRQYHPINGNK